MKKTKWTVKKKKVIFSKGPIHLVDCDVRMPDGLHLSRQIIEHPGAVVIIPKTAKNKYLLIRQFRFAARDWLWEWPAGGLEPGEGKRAAARRELAEETGFSPRSLKHLFSFYPTPGISSEVMHLFLGWDLVPKKAQGDEDERIEVQSFTLDEMGRMIQEGLICDGKTLLGYFFLRNSARGGDISK